MAAATKTLAKMNQRYDTAIFIASVAVILGASFFLFAVGPALIERFRLVASATNRTAEALFWLLPSAAAGIAFGGAALGLMTVVRLVRELEKNPFAWLAPLLAVFSAVIIAGVDFELPISSVQQAHFAVLSVVLIVGGGALALLPHWSSKALGAAVSLFPVAAFVMGYVLQKGGARAAWSTLDGRALYVLIMLVSTCFAVLLIAFVVGSDRAQRFEREGGRVSRSKARASGPAGAVAAQDWQQLEYEAAALQDEQAKLESYRQQSEAEIERQYRNLQAQYQSLEIEREEFQREQEDVEQRLRLAVEQQERAADEQKRMRLSDDSKVVKAFGRRGVNPLLAAAALLLVAGAGAGLYLGWVKPNQQHMAKEAGLERQRAEKRERQIRLLVQKVESQKAEMEQNEQELQAARQAAADAWARADEATAALSETEEASAGKTAGSGAAARRVSRAARARRAARRKAASGAGTTVRRADDPLAGI